MDVPAPSPRRMAESGATLALGAWLCLMLVLARSAVVLALELRHHGNVELARLRLAHAFPPLFLVALAIALGGALAARSSGRLARRLFRLVAGGALAAVAFLFLWGRLDADVSRRIGLDTPVGLVALGLAALAALALAALVTPARPLFARALLEHTWLVAWPPLAALALLALYLRGTGGSLGVVMELRSVVSELQAEPWEVLRSHPDRALAAAVLCPSVEYREEGAGRPALVLPPPARVRWQIPASEGSLWLGGGVGIDHSVSEDALERYRGHAVRFRARADGAQVFEATLPIGGPRVWIELGAGRGIELAAGAELELETSLLDPSGAEVQPADPLPAGFGGLALERRTRRARTRASPARPNLVLVLIDTLRADRTSAYGCPRTTTPHLDALAARGTLFEEVMATASWTWPSTASILTGCLPEEHGVVDAASSFLPERLDTLAEALQRAGFTTGAWSGSPLIVPDKHFDQGFEFFDTSREGLVRKSDIVLPGALEWLAAAGAWRFFLYLHLMEPHAPYVPLEEGRARFAPGVPASFDPRKTVDFAWDLRRSGLTETGAPPTDRIVTAEERRWISDLYDGCVWSADRYLGLLLARLEELGLLEETIVVVTSDHGEELFDRGMLSHGHGLHRELVRVPLVLAGPGIPAARRVRAPVSGADLGPTLARLGGAEILGRERALDLLDAQSGEDALFSTRQGWWNGVNGRPLFGLRRGSLVLHFAPDAGALGRAATGAGELRLYDLERDPAEREDLAASDRERALALRAELLKRLAALAKHRPQDGAVADEGTLDLLRSLGYLGR